METLKSIPPAVAALIPVQQLEVTNGNLKEFAEAIKRLEATLEKCPKLRETDGLPEHPAMFHYFHGSTDIYICEYNRDDQMFGYAILGGDLINCEWGSFSLEALTRIEQLNIDYHFEEQSIEAALYKAYPQRFKKPQSLSA